MKAADWDTGAEPPDGVQSISREGKMAAAGAFETLFHDRCHIAIAVLFLGVSLFSWEIDCICDRR